MKLDLNSLSYDGKWYKFQEENSDLHTDGNGPELKIRPYPSSLGKFIVGDSGMVIDGAEQWKVFNYCLEDMKNFEGQDGKPIKCTEKAKKIIFDFRVMEIPSFVLGKSRQFEAQKELEEKD